AAAIILCNPPINTLSFLLNFVIEPAGQKQVLSHKYPYCHNKGAGGVCQGSFFVSAGYLNNGYNVCTIVRNALPNTGFYMAI
ncbi:MAG: hypothetical protein O7198_03985, partial [Wolbachia endosymbiont of Nomada marshamella]|nr:hypothetical protein [Wolbachia endosymbiont of Nomada marshamella]